MMTSANVGNRTSHGIIYYLMILTAAAILLQMNLLYAWAEPAQAASPRMIPDSFSMLAERVTPTVVNIRTVKTIQGGGRVFQQFMNPFDKDDPMQDFFEKFFGQQPQREFKQRSLGSGFIIDRKGFIITNNHVVEGADQIQVIFSDESKREYAAEIVGRDPNTDLALLKIESEQNLPVVVLGDSNVLKVGEWVMAIGSPFGLEHTVTAGIVSAKGRIIGSGPYDDFIQTDASINPGNSGGPLINMNGEVIGINTAIIASGQGIGFAIPINLARGVIEQLKTSGEVTRGWLGVGIQDLSQEIVDYYGLKERKGVMVMQVFPGDPADKAGITPRDIILSVNGKPVGNSRDLTRMIAGIHVGETVKIKVLRDGKEKAFLVEIAKREDQKTYSKLQNPKTQEDELGIRVENLTPEMIRRFNLPEPDGVIVAALKPDGKGANAGLKVGDIIKEINRLPVKTVNEYRNAVNKAANGGAIQLFIRRGNAGFLVVKITK